MVVSLDNTQAARSLKTEEKIVSNDQKGAHMKRTFVVPDEKEDVYLKFKDLVPEVSSKLVELIEEYVGKHEALLAKMTEQTIYEGTEYFGQNIFEGKTLKFNGVQLSKGSPAGYPDQKIEVYLTLKGKYLVYRESDNEEINAKESGYVVYESYADMKAKADLPQNLISDCEAYLAKNSTIRTYEVLDV